MQVRLSLSYGLRSDEDGERSLPAGCPGRRPGLEGTVDECGTQVERRNGTFRGATLRF